MGVEDIEITTHEFWMNSVGEEKVRWVGKERQEKFFKNLYSLFIFLVFSLSEIVLLSFFKR